MIQLSLFNLRCFKRNPEYNINYLSLNIHINICIIQYSCKQINEIIFAMEFFLMKLRKSNVYDSDILLM